MITEFDRRVEILKRDETNPTEYKWGSVPFVLRLPLS